MWRSGSAPSWGLGSGRFDSCHPDRVVAQLGQRAAFGTRRPPVRVRPARPPGGASRRGDGTPFEAGRAQALAVRLRPPPHDGRCPAGRGASLEATYRVTPAGVRVAHLPHRGDASRPVPAAALKAVGVRPCAFDSRRLRHAPLAEWLSTGLLTRGGQFDPDAAYHLPPVAQRTEHPGPNGTVARSSRARRTPGNAVGA